MLGLFVSAMGLMCGCSDRTAAPTGFGNANIAPHEHSLKMQAPLQRPTSFEGYRSRHKTDVTAAVAAAP
ncbi:MAG: hypothetical protein ACPH79_06000 [Paracoccaceae bacterium]